MGTSRSPRSDTGEDWRALGFYHEPDTAARVWRFTGAPSGLRTLVRMLTSQAETADRGEPVAPLPVGPYRDFHIRVWERAGIDDESIYGPAADLRRLGQLLESRIVSTSVGDSFVIGSEYAIDAEYSLAFEIEDEGFDPASAMPAVTEEDDLVERDDEPRAIHAPALAFTFHEDDEPFLRESEGMIWVEGDEVVIEHQSKDAFFGTFKSDVRVARVPLDAISWVKFRRGLFGGQLSIQASGLKVLEEIPASKQGRLRLKFARDVRNEAQHLAEVLRHMIGAGQ